MKIQLPGLVLILCAIGIMAACKKDAIKPVEQSELVQGNIAGVNAPTGGAVNQQLKFDVLLQKADTTLRFSHLLDSVVHNNTHIIKLYNRTNVADTIGRSITSVTYLFKAAKPGTYFIKFYKPGNTDKTAIVDTVVIK